MIENLISVETVKYIVSLLAGGLLGTLLSHKLGVKKQQLDEFNILTNKYDKYIETIESRLEAVEEELKDLKIVEVKQREKIISQQNIIIKLQKQLQES